MLSPDLQRIVHILEYCEDVQKTIARFGASFEDFQADTDYQKSISFDILQIGELTGGLSEAFRKDTADRIQWPQVKSMRNWIAHNYGGTELSIVWNTALTDIPALKSFCEELLAEAES